MDGLGEFEFNMFILSLTSTCLSNIESKLPSNYLYQTNKA